MNIAAILILLCILVSVIFAVMFNQATNAQLWALWAIFLVLYLGGKWPFGG